MTTEKENSLQTILKKTVDGKKVFGTSFAIKKDTLVWNGVGSPFLVQVKSRHIF